MTHDAPPARFVDAHVHHWDPADLVNYPHLAPDFDVSSLGVLGGDPMKRRYLQAEYLADARPWNLVDYVHVNATSGHRAYLAEVKQLEEWARSGAGPGAFVGSVDLRLRPADVERDLAAQNSSDLFRGIRVRRVPDLRAPAFARALAFLQDNGLVYDLVVHPESLADMAGVLEPYERLTVVVEHTGWPTALDPDHFEVWAAGMRRLASMREGVSCKLSGLAMTTHSFDSEAIAPWFQAAIEIFGIERCMVASNFPVDGVFGTFDTMMATYLRVLRPYGERALEAMFAGNAERVYRLAQGTAPPPSTAIVAPVT